MKKTILFFILMLAFITYINFDFEDNKQKNNIQITHENDGGTSISLKSIPKKVTIEEQPKTINNSSNKKNAYLASDYNFSEEYIESYKHFDKLVKQFQSNGNGSIKTRFNNSDVDLKWTDRMRDITYNEIEYHPETGEQRFPNLQFNNIDCRTSICRLEIKALDSNQAGSIATLGSFLLGSRNKENANDNRSIMTKHTKEGVTFVYFSRSVNDG